MRRTGVALLCGVVLAGCGGETALDGSIGAGVSAGIPVVPGQVGDFTAYLNNRSSHPVTLESVAGLLPARGFRTPRSGGHFAMQGRDVVGAGLGWPPQGLGGQRLVPFAGYRVAPHRRAALLFTIVADAPGDYAVRGLRLRTRVDGSEQTIDALSSGLICVFPRATARPDCPQAAVQRLQADGG